MPDEIKNHIPRVYVVEDPATAIKHRMVCSCGQFDQFSIDGLQSLGREFDRHLQPIRDGEVLVLARIIADAIGIPVFPMGRNEWWPKIDDQDVIRAAERVLETYREKKAG